MGLNISDSIWAFFFFNKFFLDTQVLLQTQQAVSSSYSHSDDIPFYVYLLTEISLMMAYIPNSSKQPVENGRIPGPAFSVNI